MEENNTTIETQKWLYDKLTSKNINLGSFEQFSENLNDNQTREWVYNKATQSGLNLGTYDDFNNNIISVKPASQTTNTDTTVAVANPVEEVKSSTTIKPETTDDEYFGDPEFSPEAMRNRMKKIENVAKETKSSLDNKSRELSEELDNLSLSSPIATGHTKDNGLQFNPSTGKLERTFSTPYGNTTTNKQIADLESYEYRTANNMTVSRRMRNANIRLEKLKAQAEERQRKVVEEWEQKQNEEYKDAQDKGFWGILQHSIRNTNNPSNTPRTKIEGDPEYRALQAAIHETEEEIATIKRESDRQDGKRVGFWRGFGEITGDIRTWDFGIGNLLDNGAKLSIDNELAEQHKSEGTRQAEQELLEATYLNQQAQQEYGANDSFWFRAGTMTGHMPSFMLDFALTGGGFDGINILSKAATKGATKVIGKEVVEKMAEEGFKSYVKKNGIKGFGQEAANWTIKALGTTADDLIIRAPLMTNTVAVAKTASDIADRKLGNVVINEDGTYDFSNDRTWSSAIWQGEANAIIENFSEMFGTHLPSIKPADIAKLAEVMGAKRLGNILAKANTVSLTTIQESLRKMGVSDYFGEVTEEYYGQLWRTMLNLDDAYIHNPDGTRTNLLATGRFHGDVWGGMALSMGLMGAGKYSLSAANYAMMKHDVNKADSRARELFGDDIWEPLRHTIDLTTNDDMGDYIANVLADDKFTAEEKEAVLNYTERSLYLRGFNLATLAQSRNTDETDNDIIAQQNNESYLDGYNASDPQEMNDVRNTLDIAKEKMVRIFGLADESDIDDFLGEDPIMTVAVRRRNGEDEESSQAILDYLNSKATYDGMIQRVRDDIDGQIEQSNALIDSHTNKRTGMIHGAVSKENGKLVYIVSGNVVAYDDGTGIDLQKSDESIIIRDAETGELKQVSPDFLSSVYDVQNPNEQKEINAQQIREKIATEESNKIDGVVDFNDKTQFLNNAANQIAITMILAQRGLDSDYIKTFLNNAQIVENPDGTLTFTDGQNEVAVPKQEIQQQVDTNNKQRAVDFSEKEKEMRSAIQQATARQANLETENNHDNTSLTEKKDVSLQAQEQQDEVPQRISQNNDRTQASQNGRMEEAAIRLRSGSETFVRTGRRSQSEISESEVKEAESYAKENGIWIPFNDVFNLGRPGKSGNENDTYFSPEGYVYKVNNLINSGDIASLLERLLLHNQVFPETAYELVGFTGFEGRNVYPIVKQSAVNNPTEATTEEIETYMTSLGFTKISETGYTNNEIVVSDLHPRNVLKDADGDIYVVDAEFKKTSQSLIPKDESGNPIYEQADSETAWDALIEDAEGDEMMVGEVAKSMIADKEAELKKLEKSKIKEGKTPAEKMAALKERKAEVEKIKKDIEAWKEIAFVPIRRQIAQEKRIHQEEAAAKRKAEEERLMAERQKMDLTEREKLDGTPDIIDDIPNNARLRGYRRVNGHLVERQQPIQAIQGKETDVEFSNDVRPKGHYAVIDASQLQPSHIQGNRNPLHFLDEAQPKERNDEASIVSAQKIAGNIRPATITTGETAYVGTPTINTRGEVIQGNSRSDALRLMWNNHQEQGQKYKQYLIDNAEQFGLNPEDVSNMESPVLVRMLDVSDEQAITLGQYVAQDTESGGVERIKPKNAVKKMGDDINSFANMLLDSADEDTSFAELLDQNGVKVLKWMAQKGYITDTQYSSAFDTKGSLTAEAKNDLRGIMYQSIFEGGNTRLEEMFNALPAKAQKAILATAHRDFNSPNSERMIEEIQNSIRAFYALMQDEQFANAKDFRSALIAVDAWQRQYQMDDVTGESYLPTEKFSNFALHLATLYKGKKQSNIQGVFTELYDLIQGAKEDNLFEQADNTPRTLVQAIKEVLNIDYNGQRRNNVLVGNNKTSQQGESGSNRNAGDRERTESNERTDVNSGRAEGNSGKRGETKTYPVSEENKVRLSDPRTMSDEEKQRRGNMLRNAPAIEVQKNIITSTPLLSARKAAEKWWDDNISEPVLYNTEAGEVEINRNSIESSLAHRYGQKKLDAITSLIEGFENAVYLGTMEDVTRQEGVLNHYFAYPITYNGELNYVFCRAMQDTNKNRLYVHEVFLAEKIKKGDTLQTAAFQPHGGISLYRDILANILDSNSDSKDTTILPTTNELEEKKSQDDVKDSPIQGYSYEEIIETITDEITDIISDNGIEGVSIKEIWAHGSRMRGDSKSDSDLDIVMFYEGDAREDDLFNLISELNLAIEGIKIDVNPIRVSSHKDIEAYKKKSKQYDEEKKASTIGERILAAEKEVNTSPTDKQKEAGNYKKGHVQIGTFNVTIEQPKGSVRSGVDANGKKWETTMHNTYGYIRGTEGVDGDHIDVFLSNDIDGWNGNKIFVVDQYNEDGTFDEHKVMLGFNDIEEAESAYLDNYEKGWEKKHKIVVSPIHTEEFEKWINSSHRKTKAFAEYKSVQVSEKRTNDREKRQQLSKFNVGDIVLDYYNQKLYRIKKHSTNGVSTIAELDAEGNEVGATTMNAHNNSRYSLAEAPVKAETPTISQDSEQVSDQDNAPYTIAPAQYTTKKGKVLDMHLVKFAGTLTKEQQRAAKELARAEKGWYDAKQGGFMMRNEESAKQLAETILSNEEAVSDAQPVSIDDIKSLNDGKVLFTEPQQPKEQPKTHKNKNVHVPIWQYIIHVYDDGYTMLSRDDISGETPILDDWGYSAESPEEMLEILRNPQNNMQDVLKSVETTLENKIKTRELDRKIKEEREQKLTELRTNGVKGYKIGDEVIYKGKKATIHDFEEYGDNEPVLDVGLAPVMYEVARWSEIKKPQQDQEETLSKTIDTTSLLDVVRTLYTKGKDVASKLFSMKFFDVAQTPKFMQELGLRGDKFTIKYGVIARHLGKDSSHTLTERDWEQLPQALQNPFAISKLTNKDNSYRIYTTLQTEGGEFVVVGADVKNAGREIEVNAISTVFGRRNNANLPKNEEVIYRSKEITPEQSSLLKRPNFAQYPTEQELSEGKDTTISYNSNEKSTNPSGNRLVTDERYAELRERMRKKLGGQMNIGIDPEILAIGTEMAVYHLEKGARKFAEYAKSMIADLGDVIRPYLKAFYNGARELPEVIETRLSEEMTPYEEVRAFDVTNFDKTSVNAFATAETVMREEEVEKEVEIAKDRIKKTRNSHNNKKKSVTSQNQTNMFDDLFNNENTNEDGLQGIYEVRSERLSTDSDRNSGTGSKTGNSQEVQQESGRTDGDRVGGSQRIRREIQHGDVRSSGRIQGITEKKNTRNNRSERGKDHAPASVDARIEANIKAIELAKQLLENGEQASKEQMEVLRKFSGWGGLGKAFNERASYVHEGRYYYNEPTIENKKIRELLGEEAYQQAVMSANSAYYTPAYVVDTLWDIAQQIGFEGGNILEGSAGIGNILGQMPAAISERSNIHAIEIDNTSGAILSLLYPDAKVEIQGFEETRIANGSVDLAITNVPFVIGLRVNDTTGDKDLSKKFHNIHDFCIAKNVRKLREGGLGIFITSNGTLDNSKKLRDWIVSEGNSDFVGAFRMHNKTFGGTSVTSDIIVIRKRVNGQKSANAIDVSSVSGERVADYNTGETRKVKGVETPVVKQLSMDYNQYFIEHPEMMSGKMHFAFEKGDTFRPTSKGLYPSQDKNQEQMLTEFVKSFKEEETGAKTSNNTDNVIDAVPGKKIGEVFVKDGKLYINAIGAAQPLDVNANKVKGHTKAECFNAYSAIKETLAEVLEYQTKHENDNGLNPLITKLNKAYDDFVKTYGHFNKNTAIAFLRNDVDYANVASIETYKEIGDGKGGVKQTFGKADVMKKRVIEKDKEPTPTNVKDGIIASLFIHGRVDIPYIANQLGLTEDDVKRGIIDKGLGFENPVTRQMEVSYQYLSGNVREKLLQARENNENGEFDRNIKALQDVLPMDIPAHLIDFTLGSSWVEPELYNEYVKDRTDVDVKFTAVGGTWFMKEPYFTNYEKNRSMGVTSEMLGKTIMGHILIEAAIQNKSITVSTIRKNWDGTTETIVDKEATQACASKIDEIRQDFKEWARQKMQSDPEMSAKMERIYNDTFNNYVPMKVTEEFLPKYFIGAIHKYEMRPHQKRAIVRGTMQPLMLAHEVGSGKTFTLISTAMEMRRLGTARKPMIVVQNATVGQFVANAKELYPNAKILTLEDSDRNAEGRKNFYAKIKYNDWDMIIIPQSTFEFIPDSEERQMTFVQDKIEEKMLILEQMKEADPEGNSMITRQAEREIALLEEELAGLSETASRKRTANDEKRRAVALQNAEVKAMEMLDRRTDDVENFDDMGIDALLVDEAHEYKHLGFATAMQRGVKGVDPSYSKKSQGVFLKTQAVLEKNNGRNVIFATGTPISNTAAEIWTFMRYLMPADTMKEYGIYYFDDFVRNFGNIQQMLEFTTSGKFKENNCFAGYVNLPELVRIWSGVSDTVNFEDIEEDLKKQGKGDLRPEIETGKAQDIYLPQTRALRSIMKFVKAQLEKYDQMSGKQKKENSHIPLTMYGIAKAAAVDARLVEKDAEDDPNSKTNEAVRQTLRSLKETENYKGTVAIFADNYQNKHTGFNLYEDIRTKLIAEGVNENEIVVIKSGMTVKKKLEIFEKVNRGEIRVILGSTFTLGTGVNIQERLHTLIHLDAPNRPMDYTQRNGRIQRQGNIHKDMGIPVRILRFGVEDSLDVTAYQRLKTKGAIADSIMKGKQMMSDSMSNRVLEEEEDVFGDTVAQLSGSEYAMLKNNAEKNVRKYESRRKQWEADQTYIHNAKPRIKGLIKDAEKRIEDNSRYLEAVRASFPDGKFKEIVIGKHRFATIEAMEDFFKEYNKNIIADTKKIKDGEMSGNQTRELTIQIGDYSFIVKTELTKEYSGKGMNLFAEVHRKMTYSCPQLGIEDAPVRQALLRNGVEDIVGNVITGKDFAERLESAERSKDHNESELEQLMSREGKPFEYEKELDQAKKQFIEYSELMKKEMAEKEAKYAEMDASVESATDISNTEEEDDVLYREDENDTAPETAVQHGAGHSTVVSSADGAKILKDLDNTITEYKNKTSNRQKTFIGDLSRALNLRNNGNNSNYGSFIAINGKSLELRISDHNVSTKNMADAGKIDGISIVITHKPNKGINNDDSRAHIVEFYYNTQKLQKESGQPYVKILESIKQSLYSGEYKDNTGLAVREEVNEDAIYSNNEWYRTGQNSNSSPTRAQRKQMIEHVEDLAKRLHLDNIEIVNSVSGLEGKKKGAKGFFSKKSGKITIVVPNHTSIADIEKTLLHEAVAHYGLRKLFGKHFDTFLDNVYNNVEESIRKHIAELAIKKYNYDFRKATEEYLASLAERTNFENIQQSSWWQKIKDFFADMLSKLGFKDFRGVTLTDNELRYILWRSYENLSSNKYNGIFGEAADIAKQYELGTGEFENDSDIMFRDGVPEIHEKVLVRDKYDRRIKTGWYQSKEALQDSMLSLKEAMKDIAGLEIEDIDGFENAYLGENRLSSVNKAEADAFARILFKPMLDEVAKLSPTAAERQELVDYMMAKHGLERNIKMAEREAKETGKSLAECRKRDYAGLTALTGFDNTQDAETEAQRMVDEYESNHDTTDLWNKVNAVSIAILSKSYECGLMDKDTFDNISNMYEFYIPLRGFDEKTSADAYAYLSHKHSAFNAPIKKAEGRSSKADDPFANLQSMAESTIMQGNRNRLVKQRFLNFTLNNPSDLVSISELWLEYDNVDDEWRPVFPDNIDTNDSGEVVEQKIKDFEEKMELLAQNEPDRYKKGRDAIGIPYRVVENRDLQQHQVIVKRNGRDVILTTNGNPRLAQALNGQTNPDNDMSGAIGAILRSGEWVNRQLSAFYTTRNPDFVVSNFLRDMLYSNSMAWIKESPNYALRFHRNYMMANPFKMKRLLSKYRNENLDMNDNVEKMFYQFMMNGGETGYVNIRDIEQHKNDIRKELRKSNGRLKISRALSLLAERFDELNRAIENCARFAAFMTSKEMGRTTDRAIYDAKEISVNFNKKGSGSKFYGEVGQTVAGNASALVSGLGRSSFVFWNAAIQGTTNFGRQIKRHPAKAFTGIASMFLLGALVAFLGGDDDDDDNKNSYYNLPEYVRRSNILFRAGEHWISIPLPVEYRAIYGLGELMTSTISGKEHLTDSEIAEAIIGQMSQVLPLDFMEGGGGLNAVIPSAAKPLWEAYVAEKSWTGLPLYKDTPYNKNMPEWTKAYKSANKHIVGLAEALNEATGGDRYTKGNIDINPAKIEYVLKGYFGGIYNTIDKMSKMAETAVGGREYDPQNFLLLNRVVKAGDERTEYRAVNNEYFRLKEEHDNLRSRIKNYEKDTYNGIFDYADKIDFLYNSPEYLRYEIFELYRKDIESLNEILKNTYDNDERKELESYLNELKKEMIEEMNKTRKRKRA